jgi:hypothetical protein
MGQFLKVSLLFRPSAPEPATLASQLGSPGRSEVRPASDLSRREARRLLTCDEHARMLLTCLEWSKSGTCRMRSTVS